MARVTPFLWFDKEAQEAAKFYTSVFPDSKITMDTPMMVGFTLNGQDFMAINGGPNFKFNEAVSFYVGCRDQKEVDYYWEKLSAHPESEQCGWLKDKYGLSWQIIPDKLGELMSGPDQARSKRVMTAMLKMKKIDIETLEEA